MFVRAGGFDDRGEFIEGFAPGQIPFPHSIGPHSGDGKDAIGNAQTELALDILPAPELCIFNRKCFLAAAENASRPVAYPANDREKGRGVHHDAVDVVGDSVGRSFDRMMKTHVLIAIGRRAGAQAGTADEDLMATLRKVAGQQFHHRRFVFDFRVEIGQHQDAQIACAPQAVLPPWLNSSWREGNIVGTVIAEVRAVIGIVLEKPPVPLPQVAAFANSSLDFFLRVIAAAGFGLRNE